ncbi:MFS general substrate transporter [Gonapodya prolifera JEL478]|uniref:MFS general substrate transporter n=1 Tax=Gonapodya prolifera (strain JEL478) TaxID=1344416 RepID=A0A139AEW4_GONPJ|nr:MFS general substrate transporter [Gonapodya prolifera JEL478]|eukprot:KXS15362.1 MFS general substrate transporter [Gonapodya prolifera JEL478]
MTNSQIDSDDTIAHRVHHRPEAADLELASRTANGSEDNTELVAQNSTQEAAEGGKNPEELDFPEGGYGWVVAAAAFTTVAISVGQQLTFGAGATNVTIAVLGGVCVAILPGVGPFSGKLADSIGYRRTALLGAFLQCLGYFLACFSSLELRQVVLWQAVISPIGQSSFPATAVVAHWFLRRRGFAMGLISAGGGIGGLVLAPTLQAILDRAGLRATFVFLCVLTGVGVGAIEKLGTSTTIASVTLAVNAAGQGIGRFIWASVALRVGYLHMYCIVIGVPALLAWVLWTNAINLGLLITFSFTFGMFGGGFIVMNPLIAPDLFGYVQMASVIGMLFGSFAPGQMLGPVIFGALLDRNPVLVRTQVTHPDGSTSVLETTERNYFVAIMACGAFYCAGLVFILWLQFEKAGWKVWARV